VSTQCRDRDEKRLARKTVYDSRKAEALEAQNVMARRLAQNAPSTKTMGGLEILRGLYGAKEVVGRCEQMGDLDVLLERDRVVDVTVVLRSLVVSGRLVIPSGFSKVCFDSYHLFTSTSFYIYIEMG
jgi:hypothetical protein